MLLVKTPLWGPAACVLLLEKLVLAQERYGIETVMGRAGAGVHLISREARLTPRGFPAVPLLPPCQPLLSQTLVVPLRGDLLHSAPLQPGGLSLLLRGLILQGRQCLISLVCIFSWAPCQGTSRSLHLTAQFLQHLLLILNNAFFNLTNIC